MDIIPPRLNQRETQHAQKPQHIDSSVKGTDRMANALPSPLAETNSRSQWSWAGPSSYFLENTWGTLGSALTPVLETVTVFSHVGSRITASAARVIINSSPALQPHEGRFTAEPMEFDGDEKEIHHESTNSDTRRRPTRGATADTNAFDGSDGHGDRQPPSEMAPGLGASYASALYGPDKGVAAADANAFGARSVLRRPFDMPQAPGAGDELDGLVIHTNGAIDDDGLANALALFEPEDPHWDTAAAEAAAAEAASAERAAALTAAASVSTDFFAAASATPSPSPTPQPALQFPSGINAEASGFAAIAASRPDSQTNHQNTHSSDLDVIQTSMAAAAATATAETGPATFNGSHKSVPTAHAAGFAWSSRSGPEITQQTENFDAYESEDTITFYLGFRAVQPRLARSHRPAPSPAAEERRSSRPASFPPSASAALAAAHSRALEQAKPFTAFPFMQRTQSTHTSSMLVTPLIFSRATTSTLLSFGQLILASIFPWSNHSRPFRFGLPASLSNTAAKLAATGNDSGVSSDTEVGSRRPTLPNTPAARNTNGPHRTSSGLSRVFSDLVSERDVLINEADTLETQRKNLEYNLYEIEAALTELTNRKRKLTESLKTVVDREDVIAQRVDLLEQRINNIGDKSVIKFGKTNLSISKVDESLIHFDQMSSAQSALPNTCIKTLFGHIDAVECVDFESPRGILVSGSADRTLRVWSLDSHRCIGTLEGHTGWLRAVQVGGTTVMSGSNDHTIRQWDISRLRMFEDATASSDRDNNGRVSVESRYDAESSQSASKSIRDSCMPSNRRRLLLLEAASFNGDSTVAESGSTSGVSDSFSMGDTHARHTSSVNQNDAGDDDDNGHDSDSSGARNDPHVQTFVGHTSGVTSLMFDAHSLVSGAADATMRHWDISTGKTLSVLRIEERIDVLNTSRPSSSSNGRTFGLGIDQLSLDNVPFSSTMTRTETAELLGMPWMSSDASYERSSVSSLGYESAASSVRHSTVFGQPEFDGWSRSDVASMLPVSSSTLPNIGSPVLSSSYRHQHVRHASGASSVMSSSAAYTQSPMPSAAMECVPGSPVPSDSSAGFSETTTTPALGKRSSDQAYPSATSPSLSAGGNARMTTRTVGGHVSSLHFWQHALVAGYGDGVVRLWDLRTSRCHRQLHDGHVGAITAVRLDDLQIISAGVDRTVKIWDLRMGQPIDLLQLDGAVASLSVDTTRIAVAAAGSKDIRVLNRASGIVRTLSGAHTRPVRTVRHAGDTLVSGGLDATVRIWRIDA